MNKLEMIFQYWILLVLIWLILFISGAIVYVTIEGIKNL
jgi:hypothetical protein